jgi:hypothetical protein
MKQCDSDVTYQAKYAMKCTDGVYQFTFFCAYCGFHHNTRPIGAGSAGEAYLIAEREARKDFNGCHRCGRWVCDDHFNMTELMCLECAQLNDHAEEYQREGVMLS